MMLKILTPKEWLIAGAAIAVGLFAAYFIGELAFIGGRLKGYRESERAFQKALENGFEVTSFSASEPDPSGPKSVVH